MSNEYLTIGDKIYCKISIGDITVGEEYIVTNLRPKDRFNGHDICILDDSGCNWWFGQKGETECWDNWFVSEKEWLREKKIEQLGL